MFIEKYKRLPYLPDDDVEVTTIESDGSEVVKPYRANKYIKLFYKNQDKMTESLFDNEVITYKTIAEALKTTETLVKNTILKTTKSPDTRVRRAVHIFFNKDLYEKELGKYNTKCTGCKKRCKIDYYIDVVRCPKYVLKSKENKKQTD